MVAEATAIETVQTDIGRGKPWTGIEHKHTVSSKKNYFPTFRTIKILCVTMIPIADPLQGYGGTG